jgi:hypothetical protein
VTPPPTIEITLTSFTAAEGTIATARLRNCPFGVTVLLLPEPFSIAATAKDIKDLRALEITGISVCLREETR